MRLLGVVVRTVCHRIVVVPARSIPTQVRQPIVRCITVDMAGEHTFWARSYERFQNKAMDVGRALAPISRQTDLAMTSVVRAATQYVIKAVAYSTAVGYFVCGLEADHRFPLLAFNRA